MVDTKRLGFSQGIDISFLSEEAQQWVSVWYTSDVPVADT